MKVAITRQVSPALGDCELTHLDREPIDVDLARRQHGAYERLLADLGYRVESLPPAPELPDSVFVEDTAVVLDEVAIVARPGAASRRPETHAVARALEPYRRLEHLEAPATLDGGDVLRLGRTLYVGETPRTNRQGVAQLRRRVEPLGYRVATVAVTGCLHLKSAVTEIAHDALLVNPGMIDPALFGGRRAIPVDEAEPMAANALRVGDSVILPAHYPRTRRKLEALGLDARPVEATEVAKAEGGVTCCSLLVDPARPQGAP